MIFAVILMPSPDVSIEFDQLEANSRDFNFGTKDEAAPKERINPDRLDIPSCFRMFSEPETLEGDD